METFTYLATDCFWMPKLGGPSALIVPNADRLDTNLKDLRDQVHTAPFNYARYKITAYTIKPNDRYPKEAVIVELWPAERHTIIGGAVEGIEIERYVFETKHWMRVVDVAKKKDLFGVLGPQHPYNDESPLHV
mgnify:CR=1 FL=1